VWGAAAIEHGNSDSISTNNVVIGVGGNTYYSGSINRIVKPGVRMNGTNTATASLASRNNVFHDIDLGPQGTFVTIGLSSSGARLTNQSGPTYIQNYNLSNGAQIPSAEGGTYLDWNPNGGINEFHQGPVLTGSQTLTAAAVNFLTGSLVTVPPQGFQVGTTLRWLVTMTKTAAGTAARNVFIKIGTNGGVADTNVATFTSSVPTAAADQGFMDIMFTIYGPLGASCVAVSSLYLAHNSFSSGFAPKPVDFYTGSMVTFNTTTGQQFVSLAVTPGTAEVITVQQCLAQCYNPANP
jgi:hypothetical protein